MEVERAGHRADKERRSDSTPRFVLGLRLCQAILCLVSLSVMAANKTRGWSADCWYQYNEYRYCFAINVIGFLYSGFQGFYLSYQLAKNSTSSALRHQLDFVMDQILAYLFMLASSSAATLINDWAKNWSKDDFTTMASVSIVMSFFAFFAFAFSSTASGYCLCNRNSS